MLKGDFFYLIKKESGPDNARARVRLNPEHRIFEGHFPGTPVVPGVCIVQMAMECAADIWGISPVMPVAQEIKFLNLVVPQTFPELDFTYTIKQKTDDGLWLQITVSSGDTIFTRIRCRYSVEKHD